MATAADALVIMTKLPVAGQSKTRLVPPLTYEEAADLSRALLLDQLSNLSHFADASLYVAFAPADAGDAIRSLTPAGFNFFPQRGDDLGERMANAFADVFARGCQRAELIGSDLPVLPHQTLNEAFSALSVDTPTVVLGPTTDGGYYLVGMNQPIAAMFQDITWSRSDVLERTCERLTQLGLPYKLLQPWYDIDTIDDLRRLGAAPLPVFSFMKNTFALLAEFRQTGRL